MCSETFLEPLSILDMVDFATPICQQNAKHTPSGAKRRDWSTICRSRRGKNDFVPRWHKVFLLLALHGIRIGIRLLLPHILLYFSRLHNYAYLTQRLSSSSHHTRTGKVYHGSFFNTGGIRMDVIYLDNGIGLCPCCLAQKKHFRLSPHLLPTTRGTDIPMFCRYCKTEFAVNILDGSGTAHVSSSCHKSRV